MSKDAKRASTESADSVPSPSSRRNVVTAAPVERDSFSDVGSAAAAASSPCLRNAATAAPGEKVASLESADGAESVRAYDEDEIAHLEGGGPHDASTASVEPPTPPYSLAPAKARRRWREDFYDHVSLGARFKRCLHHAARREITRPVDFPRSSSTVPLASCTLRFSDSSWTT